MILFAVTVLCNSVGTHSHNKNSNWRYQNQATKAIDISRKYFKRGQNVRHQNLKPHWNSEIFIQKFEKSFKNYEISIRNRKYY